MLNYDIYHTLNYDMTIYKEQRKGSDKTVMLTDSAPAALSKNL